MTTTTLDPRDDAASPARRRRVLALAAVVVVVGLVVAGFATGTIQDLADQQRIERLVDDAGVLGPAVFLGLMVTLVPLNVPGLVFVVPATTLFGTAAGVALSLTGGFLASCIGIVAARRLGREAFQSRMPPRVLALEARLSRRGFWGVVGLRCVTFLLQPIDWLCGLSRMPMRTVVAGTFVGLIPPTLVIALTGGGLLDLIL